MMTSKALKQIISAKNIGSVRLLVQASFTIYCIYAGYRFYLFFRWASGRSNEFIPRPPSVEGFLPISGLVSLKRLFLTGHFDIIHPAGLTIFLAALFIGLFLRKGFCGWICPVGFTSNLVEKIGKKLKLLWKPPVWIDIPLLAPKYLLLFFFCYVILWQMDLQSLEVFTNTTYNKVVDAKMLLFFLDPSALSLWIMISIVVLSFFLRNFWCRYLCPYGTLLGLLAMVSPFQIRRREENCIDCKLCEKVCPGSINISKKRIVRSPECIGCMECASVCPKKECLELTAPGRNKAISLLLLPVSVVGIFLLFWAVAELTGHWHNDIPLPVLKKLYSVDMSQLAHP